MKKERLLFLEITTDHVVSEFESMYNRKPTESELGKILDNIGDLYDRVRFEYVCADLMNIITEEVENVGQELGLE